MQLRNKVTLATSGIGLLLVTLGGSGAWYILQLQKSDAALLDVNVSSIRAAEELELNVREMRHELDRFLFKQERSYLIQTLKKESELQAWQDRAQAISGSENETALLSEIKLGLKSFFMQLHEIVDSSDPVSSDILDQLEEEVLTGQVLAATDKYLHYNEQELQSSNQQSKAMAERLALVLILLGSCGAIAGLVVGYGLARRISHSILQLSVPIRDVAGKLDDIVGPIEVSTDPNLTELETILQTVSAKVTTVVEQLHERHREVIRAEQLSAVGQLAAGLAHEIRNPLMCMKTLVQSARRQGDSAKVDSQDLAVLDEEISRLDNLLQRFLDFARPAKLEAHEVDLSNVVRQTVELLSSRAQARNVTIENKLSIEPLIVQGDSAQLRQVLLNLMLNSLDAVPNGGAINVESLHADKTNRESNGQSKNYVRLLVTDNGRGLPAIDRARIYEPFFSTKETGLGLGLAISNRIIETHGGQLLARDREGGGAIFEIQLPLQTQTNNILIGSLDHLPSPSL